MTILPVIRITIAALGAALLLVACTKPSTATREFTCPDGYEFSISYSSTQNPGDIAVLKDASGSIRLPRAPAASGERYSNGTTVYWSKGDEALIQRGGKVVHENCTTE